MPSPESVGSGDPAYLADSQTLRRWSWVAWPSFLAACLIEGLVFALVDPAQLNWPAQIGSPSDRAVYSAAFFAFWIISMACAWVVLGLATGAPSGPRALSDKFGD
jgi:hypothetical protein